MKIAICIFGHVGGRIGRDGAGGLIDPLLAFKNYFKEIIQEYDTDFFIHSWSVDFKEKLMQIYAPKEAIIEEQVDFSKYQLKDYPLTHIDSYKPLCETNQVPSEYINALIFRSHSRWYSTKKTLDLMRDYSHNNNVKYDWVLQLRLDLIFYKNINFNELDPNYFYAPIRGRDKGNAIDDLWFLSNQINAIKFAKLYDHIFNYSIRPPFAAKQHLDAMEIPHKEFFEKGKEYDLMRSHLTRKRKPNTKKPLFRYLMGNPVLVIFHRALGKINNILKKLEAKLGKYTKKQI